MNNPSKAISFILKIDRYNIFAYVHIGSEVHNIYIYQPKALHCLLMNTINISPLSCSTHSKSSILFVEYCILLTTKLMLGLSSERWMIVVFSGCSISFAFTLLSTSFGMVVETVWNGIWGGMSHHRWLSSLYSGWKLFPH